HLVEEDCDIHRARLRHAVIALPGAVILVPLPDVAGEGRLGVDLELMHVDLLAEDLFDRLDHAWMGAEHAERLLIEMGGNGRARRAAFLAPDLWSVGVVDGDGLARQEIDLLLAEQLGKKQPAFAVEMIDLLLGQSHDFLLEFFERLALRCRACSMSVCFELRLAGAEVKITLRDAPSRCDKTPRAPARTSSGGSLQSVRFSRRKPPD